MNQSTDQLWNASVPAHIMQVHLKLKCSLLKKTKTKTKSDDAILKQRKWLKIMCIVYGNNSCR